MQQAYHVLRVVSEAQTIRIVLMLAPNELTLRELCTACAAFNTESSIKALVLDFETQADTPGVESTTIPADILNQAWASLRAVKAPVLAVVRGVLSAAASTLLHGADLILMAHDAALMAQDMVDHNSHAGDGRGVSIMGSGQSDPYDVHTGNSEGYLYTGAQALRLRLTTWSVPANEINAEMERILNMLRGKSAVALRHTKASVDLAAQVANVHQKDAATRLEALKQVNTFYLTQVMQTADASEGLHAFLEKRKPEWKNR